MTTFAYICAHDLPEDSLFHRHLLEFWAAVEKETAGDLHVEVTPWGQAGTSRQMLDKVLRGEIQFHPISGMPLSTVVPLVAVEGLPFAFDPEDGAEQAMDGPLGEHIGAAIRTAGLHLIPGVWPQGHNQISNDRERGLWKADDLSGFKIRTGQSDYLVDLYRSLGADPRPIHLQGIGDALSSGMAEGVEVPYSLMVELHVTPPQSSIAVVDVRWATFWMTANQSAWSELPEGIRHVILRVHRQHVRNYRKEIAEHNRAARSHLDDAGIQFTRLPAAELRTRLIEEGFYARWRGEFGETTWKLIKQATGRTPDEVRSA